MYYVSKRMEIAGAHRLNLPYGSKCSNLHGHNWIVTVFCCAREVNPKTGMVIDFTKIKEAIHGRLDHAYINDVLPDMNPTAENMAKWICDEINRVSDYGACYKVTVQESEGNIATYKAETVIVPGGDYVG